MSVSIWNLNERAQLLYAKNAVGAQPHELPDVANRAFALVAEECDLRVVESTKNDTFSATIWKDEDGNLVNCVNDFKVERELQFDLTDALLHVIRFADLVVMAGLEQINESLRSG